MKLRQKLAAVLAATMVVTAVPVTTMAASTNRITRTETVGKDKPFATELVVELKDDLTTGSVFFLELEGGEFTKVTSEEAKLEVSNDKKETTVKVNDTITAGTTLKFAINGTAKEAEAILKLIAENTTLTDGKFVVARTSEAKATVSIGDTTNLYTEGKIADIKIEEAVAGNIEKGDIFTLALENDDFKFVNAGTVKVSKGFTEDYITVTTRKVNDQEIEVKVTDIKGDKPSARGLITVEGLEVKSTVKAPETGDLMVSVEGKKVEEKAHKVATVSDYGVSLTMKDEKVVEFVAGQDKEVEFSIKENVNDSINAGRFVEFRLTEGFFTTGSTITMGDETIKVDVEKTTNDKNLSLIVEKIDDVKRVVGFEAKLNTKDTDSEKVRDEYKFKAKVTTPVDFTGDVKLEAEGRAIGEELSLTVATVKAPVKVETEAAQLKVGLKGQTAGKVVITETEKAMLKKGETLVFDLAKEDGITFTGKPEVKVTAGDIVLGDVKLDEKNNKLTVEVKRASREAATIELTGFEVKLDRTVPQGKYDLTIGGKALAANGTTLKVEDFFIVGTPNTEDITNGMRKGTAAFVNGATTYTVNGETKEMDGAAFISKAGRMMLPVRYVSEAFGIEGNNVIFADGTVTILAGTRTLQLKNGSDIAVLNGAQIKMAEKVVIKDGRTYVPVGEVGRLLGVSVSFDDATKTATFENK